jgi:heme/copper-type cytochrome/quinol oxidase subunit 2
VTLVKRRALALILIIVIALSVASWLVYSKISELQAENRELREQLKELQEQIESVKITGFEWESGFNYVGALILVNVANVTVLNNDAKNMSGVTLTVRLVYNGTDLGYSEGFTEKIDLLHAGESLEISGWVSSGLGNRPNGTECISTLKWGKVVLDERTETIMW